MSAGMMGAARHVMAGSIADSIEKAICSALLSIYPDDPEAAEAAIRAEADFIRRGSSAIGDKVARALVDAGRKPALPQQRLVGSGYIKSMLR